MNEKNILSSRGKTFYWVSKSENVNAKNLVFLPGLSANHHLFDSQIQYFSHSHNILVWDAPAHGKSRPYSDFSYVHLAEELKTILSAEGMKKVVLIGQSAGGFVAQSFVRKYSDIVTGIMTIGTCPYDNSYYGKSDFFWLKQTRWIFGLYPDKLLRKTIAKMCGATDKGRKNTLFMLEGYSKKELCRLLHLGFAGFIPEVWNFEIPCPVYLVVGDKDKTGRVRKYNELWHKDKAYPLYIIKGASHNANVDKPDEINAIIEKLLTEL